ncbi:DUF6510 family protein [Spirosoma sp. SC4-14]|uniref:DUF6510 family protein n=1 Tax=Spirosoma sp. SC4-14 TaxID=3128900 RepID=UPI0030D5674F
MITDTDAIDLALRLDGNAVAGDFQALVGFDVTMLQMVCTHCLKEGIFANLLAYVRGPGIVLRCPTCEGLVLQLTKTPLGVVVYVDERTDRVPNETLLNAINQLL